MNAAQRADIEVTATAPFALSSRAQASGVRLVTFPHLPSTNEEAIRLARGGEKGPLWLVTDCQTSGRGRRQRPWASSRGNLASTFLYTADIAPAAASTLGFVAGVALVEALNDLCSPKVHADQSFRLKWPNDVLREGAKLAGILIEAEQIAPTQLAIAVGIGVNIVSAPHDVPYPATALKQVLPELDAPHLFEALSARWQENFAVWDHARGFDAIRTRWLAHATGLGAPVRIEIGSSIIEGVFETIDRDGRLIVRGENGARTPISAGDVYFGTAASARRM